MPVTYPVISDFTRGELSPRMDGRSDSPVFYQGMATVENWLVLPQGGVERRPGTVYFSEVQDTAKRSRLIPFVINETERYVVELYDGGVRVIEVTGTGTSTTRALLANRKTMTLDVAPATDWQVGGYVEGQASGATATLVSGSGTSWFITNLDGTFTDGEVLEAYDAAEALVTADQGAGYPAIADSTVSTTVYAYDSAAFYSEADLTELQYVQVNNKMVFSCPNKTPKVLAAFGDDGWVWADINITIPQYRQYDEVVTFVLVPGGTSGGPGVIIWEQRRIVRYVPFTYDVGAIVVYSGSYYRCIQEVKSTALPTDTNYWEVMSSNPDPNPFDTAGNYPRAVGYFQDRLFFGGTPNSPNTLFGSRTGDHSMFILGPQDDDAVMFQFLSDKSDKIQWISSREVLVVGTTGGEWVLGGPNGAITPSSVFAKRQTSFGSAAVQGKLINENVVFIQKGKRKIREYFYQNELQAYRAADLTFFSDHITESGVIDTQFQSDPDPILWCIRTDGQLIGLTYDKANAIQGWHRQVTDGVVESMAIVPNGEEDEIWITVKRTIDGSDTRYIEYFGARANAANRDRVDVDSCLTLDGGASFSHTTATAANPVQVTSTAHGLSTDDFVRLTDVAGMTEIEGRVFKITKVDSDNFTLNNEDGSGRTPGTAGTVEQVYAGVTGLSHLEGETVDVVVDGAAHQQQTVASGAISLVSGAYGNTIHVGMPYISTLKSMNLKAAVAEAGKGVVKKVAVRMINTLGITAGSDENNLEQIVVRTFDDVLGEDLALFTGEKIVPVYGQSGTDVRLWIKQTNPLPATVAVLLPEFGVEGR